MLYHKYLIFLPSVLCLLLTRCRQMKIFLATLLPHFTFKPADGVKIVKYNSIVTKPYVSGKWELGMKMPMVVEPRENKEDDA